MGCGIFTKQISLNIKSKRIIFNIEELRVVNRLVNDYLILPKSNLYLIFNTLDVQAFNLIKTMFFLRPRFKIQNLFVLK